ncbi:zinc finger, CCHC-type containing protein [Tanacetum coccineum]
MFDHLRGFKIIIHKSQILGVGGLSRASRVEDIGLLFRLHVYGKNVRYLAGYGGGRDDRHKLAATMMFNFKASCVLSKWIAKTLSIGGRITLLNSVLVVLNLVSKGYCLAIDDLVTSSHLEPRGFACVARWWLRMISSFGVLFSEGDGGSLLFVFQVQLKVFWKESSTLLGGLFGDFGNRSTFDVNKPSRSILFENIVSSSFLWCNSRSWKKEKLRYQNPHRESYLDVIQRFDADAKARLLSECEKLYSKEDLQRISRKISTWSRKGLLHKQLDKLLITHRCSVTQTVFNEAIEKGNSGTYVAEVLWNRFNGTTSLCKFSLTNHKPFSLALLAYLFTDLFLTTTIIFVRYDVTKQMAAAAQDTNNTTIRYEGKLTHLEQPLIPLPLPVTPQVVRDSYEPLYDVQNEMACLMLGIKAFHACKQEDGQSVSFYLLKMKSYLDTLECLGYVMPNELGVSLILNSLNKDYDHFEGKIQKDKKKLQWVKDKDKGKIKLAYAPKSKISPPPKRDNLTKDSVCHHCKEVGHWRRNCPSYHAELKKRKNDSGASTLSIFTIKLYAFPNKSWVYDTGCGTHISNTSQGLRGSKKLKDGALSLYVENGMRAAVEAIGSFDLVLPNSLIIVLDSCHFAPTITMGVILISRLVDNGYLHTFTNYGISISKDNVIYFNAILRDGIYEISMHNLYLNVSSMYNVSNKRAKHALDSSYL